VRAVALHPDVLVATSAIWQTNCVIVRSGEESFVIDSPVLPDELDALPALVEQAGFPPPSGLLVTHGDWDHLLGRLAFPGLALGCAETTAARMSTAPGEAQRELRGFDERFLIERPRPLALGAPQALPVPGRCAIGELELELQPTRGHTADGMAVWIPWARVLVAGDYLSAVELPALEQPCGIADGDRPAPAAHALSLAHGPLADELLAKESLDAYTATLERVRPLVQSAAYLVPGHGPPLAGARGLTVLEEDLGYLQALRELGREAQLPVGRRDRAQRARHFENVAHVSRSSAR
jgi:glyoxylase-like metal-dependent hydrolase (beta-lactamase superfamily II)